MRTVTVRALRAIARPPTPRRAPPPTLRTGSRTRTAPRLADIEAGRRRDSPGRPPANRDDQTPSAHRITPSPPISWPLHLSPERGANVLKRGTARSAIHAAPADDAQPRRRTAA